MDDQQDGITAYHGSPHDFEQFDTSKIGTGEGAQSYGHGLYFAGHEPVAKGYRDKLASEQQIYDAMMEHFGEYHPHAMNADVIDTIKSAQRNDKDVGESLKSMAAQKAKSKWDSDAAVAPHYAKLAEDKDFVQAMSRPFGHMYEVHINAHPHHLLDWDKDVSEQHPHVLDAINKLIPKDEEHRGGLQEFVANPDDYAGGAIIDYLHGAYGTKKTSEMLHGAGIKGIKYLDAGSRSDKAKQTHNYVVFDHKDVEIKRKYEQGGRVGFDDGGSVHDKFLPHGHPQRQQNLGDFLKESAVKHPDGRPKVVYHNTDRSFNEFHTNQSEMGAHFGTPAQANDILEGKYDQENHQGYPAYLNLKNPLRLRDTGNFKPRNVAYQLQEMGLLEGLGRHVSLEEMQEHLKSLGHDGIVYLNRREGISRAKGKDPERYNDYSDQMFKHHFPDAEDSYIAFDPTQIKSAIGNNGYYDPNSPRIDEHDGGRIERNTGGPVNVSKAEDTAGNFKKEHEKIHGIPVAIEVKEGHDRVKYEPDGDIKFKAKQYADYGAILGTKDADGMNTDAMVGPHKDSDKAYIIDQRKHSTGKFDEHKVMLGFNKRKKAIKAYTKSYADRHGKERVQDVVKTDIAGLKKWLKHGDLKKPAAKGALINRALEVVSRKT